MFKSVDIKMVSQKQPKMHIYFIKAKTVSCPTVFKGCSVEVGWRVNRPVCASEKEGLEVF